MELNYGDGCYKLNSEENHHQWYTVKYEIDGEILDCDEDAFTDCYGDGCNFYTQKACPKGKMPVLMKKTFSAWFKQYSISWKKFLGL